MTVLIRLATTSDLPGILAIYNDAILHSLAIWKDEPVTLADRERWFEARRAAGYPVFVADDAGRVVGYGALGDFRGGSGYRTTCENSIYVAPNEARRGIGRALLLALIDGGAAMGKTSIVAAIGLPNAPSVTLHAGCGFREVGLLPRLGVKQGRVLDLLLMQRDL